MVMISNATYPAYGPRPAAWSENIIGNLLRGRLGFDDVVITDSLDATASVRGWSTAAAALRSAASGADLLLVTGSEPTSQDVYERLVDAAGDGTLTAASLQRSYDRILALKRGLA
jgi:beta-N-acetylhexosaminidase